MRKLSIIIILNFCFFSFAQNLNLRNPLNENFKLPQNLNKNDIGIVYEISGGWSAFDSVYYYFLNSEGNVTAFLEEKPKSYIKNINVKKSIKKIDVDNNLKEKIVQLIDSKQLSTLLLYNQEDFKIKSKNKNQPLPCMISDQITYKLYFIQNNKQNSYSYYAPEYYFEKCHDKTINKIALKKFIDVLNLMKNN